MAILEQQYDSTKFTLYAINVLLQSIKQEPISDDAEITTLLEAQLAYDVLIEVKKAVLSEGWDFNTDEEYPFSPDLSGYISIPANVLDIDGGNGVVMRDWRLYDKTRQSPVFDSTVNCFVVWDVDFNGLTHPIRNYITMRAARMFQYRVFGDQAQYSFSAEDINEAYISARRSEGRTGGYNMLSSRFGLDMGALL